MVDDAEWRCALRQVERRLPSPGLPCGRARDRNNLMIGSARGLGCGAATVLPGSGTGGEVARFGLIQAPKFSSIAACKLTVLRV